MSTNQNPLTTLDGLCPRCQHTIAESATRFFCQKDSCTFALWKDNRFFLAKGKILTKEVVETLLKEGQIYMRALYSSRTDKYYDALILMSDTGAKFIHFTLDFTYTPHDHDN